MGKAIRGAAAIALASCVAACGNYVDASTEAQADTVEIPANEAVEGVAAMPVPDPAATTSVDNVIKLWDACTGTHLRTMVPSGISPDSLCYVSPVWSPDESRLVSGGEGGRTLLLWDVDRRGLGPSRRHPSGLRAHRPFRVARPADDADGLGAASPSQSNFVGACPAYIA